MGLDPVAIDRVALARLQQARQMLPMPVDQIEQLNATYLATAQSIAQGKIVFDIGLNAINTSFLNLSHSVAENIDHKT